MGCIKSGGTIKIRNNEKAEKNDLEQKKVISVYASSSECGDSDNSSEPSSMKNISKIMPNNLEIENESPKKSIKN